MRSGLATSVVHMKSIREWGTKALDLGKLFVFFTLSSLYHLCVMRVEQIKGLSSAKDGHLARQKFQGDC